MEILGVVMLAPLGGDMAMIGGCALIGLGLLALIMWLMDKI